MIKNKHTESKVKGLNLLKYLMTIVLLIIPVFFLSNKNIPVIFNDETGYWLSAAFFAGKDWSGIGSHILFYAQGYGLILAPLFWIFDNALMVYKAAILLNGFWMAGSFLCLLYIGKSVFDTKREIYVIMAAFVSTLYASNITQMNYSWPEVFLFFCFTAIAATLIKVLKTGKSSALYLLGFLTIYGFWVHQRTLGIVIAVCITIVLGIYTGTIKKKQGMVFFLIIALGAICFYGIKTVVIQNVWQVQTEKYEGESLSSVEESQSIEETVTKMQSEKNSGEDSIQESTESGVIKTTNNINSNNFKGQLHKIKSVLSLKGIRNFILSFIGKFLYAICASFMLIFVAFEYFVSQWKSEDFSSLKKNGWKRSWIVFMGISFILTIIISAVFLIKPQGGVHIVYGRYTDNILGPFLLVGLLALSDMQNEYKHYVRFFAVTAALGFIITKYMKLFELNGQAAVNTVGVFQYVSAKSVNVWLMSLKTIVVFIILYKLVHIKKLRKLWTLVAMVVCAGLWIWCGINANEQFRNSNSKCVDDSVVQAAHAISSIEDNLEDADIETPIYAVSLNSGYQTKYSGNGIQFMFPDKKVTYIDLDHIQDIERESYVLLPSGAKKPNNYVYIYQSTVYSVVIDKNSRLYEIYFDLSTKSQLNLAKMSLGEDCELIGKGNKYSAMETVNYNETVDINKGRAIHTSGEGYVVYGPYMSLEAGTYQLTMALEYKAGGDGLGILNVVNAGEVLSTVHLNKSDFVDGTYKALMQFECDDVTALEFTLYTYAGVELGVNDIYYEKISDHIEVLKGTSSGVETLNYFWKSIEEYDDITIYDNEKNIDAMEITTLNDQISEANISLQVIPSDGIEDVDGLILIPTSDEEIIKDTLSRYVILGKVGRYTVLTKAELEFLENYKESGGIVFNIGQMINSRYYKDSNSVISNRCNVRLTEGKYKVRVDVSYDDIYVQNIGTLRMEYSGLAEELPLTSELFSNGQYSYITTLDVEDTTTLNVQVQSQAEVKLEGLELYIQELQ